MDIAGETPCEIRWRGKNGQPMTFALAGRDVPEALTRLHEIARLTRADGMKAPRHAVVVALDGSGQRYLHKLR